MVKKYLPDKYTSLSREICDGASSLAPVYCGFSACIDNLYDLGLVLRALDTSDGKAERAFRAKLVALADAGHGGEIEVDWSDGASFFADLAPKRVLPGGTGVQVANQLALFGAKPVLAIERRAPALLSLLHSNVVLAKVDHDNPSALSGETAPVHPIIEFSPASQGTGPARADRIIVRFSEDPIEQDEAFASYTSNPGHAAGAAVLSGFNALKGRKLARALDWGKDLARRWSDIDIPLVHLELADFQSPDDRNDMFAAFAGLYRSIGMSFSELQQLQSDDLCTADAILEAVSNLAHDLGVSRVNIHEDRWALSLTKDDPVEELRALEFGCLTASARARAGQPTVPTGLPEDAVLAASPWPDIIEMQERGHFVSCAAPYLSNPATTIGLGDSFLAGTLAVLAGSKSTSTWKDPP